MDQLAIQHRAASVDQIYLLAKKVWKVGQLVLPLGLADKVGDIGDEPIVVINSVVRLCHKGQVAQCQHGAIGCQQAHG